MTLSNVRFAKRIRGGPSLSWKDESPRLRSYVLWEFGRKTPWMAAKGSARGSFSVWMFPVASCASSRPGEIAEPAERITAEGAEESAEDAEDGNLILFSSASSALPLRPLR